jgi:hypothetical protein
VEKGRVPDGRKTEKGRDGGGTRKAGEDGPALPEFPEVPAWGFTGAGKTLDLLVSGAEKLSRGKGAGSADAAAPWESVRNLAAATLGPDDPRVWAAASRTALAMSSDRRNLEAAAALAAGAAEGMSRAAGVAGSSAAETAGRGIAGCGGPPDLEESRFSLSVLAYVRAALAAVPERDPGRPFPAPACRMEQALHPVPEAPAPDPPGPASLRLELAEAERSSGAGSREARVARSRLGGAVADEEAWSGIPGSASAPGEAPAGELLRSASGGLDRLLGRNNPDSLDARGRLARFLAGGSGPGLPPDPFPCEIPPEKDLREAARMFLEISEVRAEAAAAAQGGPRDGDAAGPGDRDAGKEGGPGDELEKLVSALREKMASIAPRQQRRLIGLLDRFPDERALGAAAAAAECERLIWGTGHGEHETVFISAVDSARRALDGFHPVSQKFASYLAEHMAAQGRPEAAGEKTAEISLIPKQELGASSREAAMPLFRGSQFMRLAGAKFLPRSLDLCAEALASLEETVSRRGSPEAGGPPPRGLPRDRLGRDILAARLLLAQVLAEWRDDHGAALDALGPFLDALRHLPPAREGPGRWPWPPELAGMALVAAGRAAYFTRDFPRAEGLVRRALDTLDPDPPDRSWLKAALATLVRVLENRAPGDRDVCRELAALLGRGGETVARDEGPDSLTALSFVSESARWHEKAGDPETALGLHRKVLDARSRLLGPFAKPSRESRAEVRRLERQARDG